MKNTEKQRQSLVKAREIMGEWKGGHIPKSSIKNGHLVVEMVFVCKLKV